MNELLDTPRIQIEPDEVLRELWAVKDKLAAESGFDVDRLLNAASARQDASGRQIVSFVEEGVTGDVDQ
jgi:hypothetical protein